jgi:hypothetical protein
MTNLHLTWQMTLAAVVAAQWTLVALASAVAPLKMRKALGASTAVLAAGWLVAFDARSLVAAKSSVAEASTVAGIKHQGSCASIRNNMTAEDLKRLVGQPDEVRSEETVRGPGSATWVYRDMRCAVHLFDDRVELVD